VHSLLGFLAVWWGRRHRRRTMTYLHFRGRNMNGAGDPLNYDYRDPRHVERYAKLAVRDPEGSTEGKHPRDADVDVMCEIHEPAPLLRVIRAKCLDCSTGMESEVRKCTAIGCAMWPYRMVTNPFRAPRELNPEQREAGVARLAAARARGRLPSEMAAAVNEHGNLQVPIHSMLVFDVSDAGSTAARRRISRWICGVTPRFCLDV
jgi:hypothetical protein